jgi:hypothetical protein
MSSSGGERSDVGGNFEDIDYDENVMTNFDFVQKHDMMRENYPGVTTLDVFGYFPNVEPTTGEDWEELGRDISNYSYLETLRVLEHALDDRKMSFFFRGLTKSSSVNYLALINHGFGVNGIQSMVPFLHNSKSLTTLFVSGNIIRREGFNLLWRALRDSPIEKLVCANCHLNPIEIDADNGPKHLVELGLCYNRINADGCRELAKLLQGENSTLTDLQLDDNQIDDEGVAILANALRNNSTLERLRLDNNKGITIEGMKLLQKLLNDISSIKATLQSNHTLIDFGDISTYCEGRSTVMHEYISLVLRVHQKLCSEAAAEAKVIGFHLNSEARANMCHLQGVEQCNATLFGQINPLHLPEVLSLIIKFHGQGELYTSLRSSIVALLSTVDREMCLQQDLSYHMVKAEDHAARAEELRVELAAIERAKGQGQLEGDQELKTKKRRRTDE